MCLHRGDVFAQSINNAKRADTLFRWLYARLWCLALKMHQLEKYHGHRRAKKNSHSYPLSCTKSSVSPHCDLPHPSGGESEAHLSVETTESNSQVISTARAFVKAHFHYKDTALPVSTGSSIIKRRRSSDFLIFIMGIPIPVKRQFYIESAPVDITLLET